MGWRWKGDDESGFKEEEERCVATKGSEKKKDANMESTSTQRNVFNGKIPNKDLSK